MSQAYEMRQLIWRNAHEMQQLIWNYAHEIIKQITRGAVIRDQVAKRMEGKAEKMAMTVELMYKLKISLRDSRFSKAEGASYGCQALCAGVEL